MPLTGGRGWRSRGAPATTTPARSSAGALSIRRSGPAGAVGSTPHSRSPPGPSPLDYALQMFGRYSFDPESRPGRWLLRHTDYQEADPVQLTGTVASWLTAHRDNRFVAYQPLEPREETV